MRRAAVLALVIAVIGAAGRPVAAALPPAWTQTTASLSQGREYLAATSVGNYALFGGGMNTGG